MALTSEQILEARKRIGIPEGGVVTTADPSVVNVSRRRQLAAEYDAKLAEKSSSFLGGIKESATKRIENLKGTAGRAISGEQSLKSTGLQVLGEGAGFVSDVQASAVGATGRALLGEDRFSKVKEAGKEAFFGEKGLILTKAAATALGAGAKAYEKFKEKNPVEAANLESVINIASLYPGAKAATKTVGAAEDVASGVAKATAGAAPAIKSVSKGAGAVGDYAIAQTTGLTPGTVEMIIKNPEAVSKAQLEGMTRSSLAEKVKSSLDKRLEELGDLGKEYESVRQSPNSVALPKNFFSKALTKYGLNVSPEGRILTTAESVPLKPGDISALESFLAQYGKEQSLTGNAFLNARKALDNLASFEATKTDIPKRIARDLRSQFDKLGKVALPDLEKLDAKYAPEVKMLKQLKKDLLDKDGTLKDIATNRIATSIGKGKDKQLARLQELVPNIAEDARILNSIENIEAAKGNTVGAYARGLILGGGIMTGNVPLILGAIATTPKIAIQLIKQYGKLKGLGAKVTDGIVSKMEKGVKLNAAEGKVLKDAIQDTEGRIGKGELPKAEAPTMGQSTITEASKLKASTQTEKIFKDYQVKNSRVVNADEFREFFVPEGYNGLNAALVHDASSDLANKFFDKMVEQSKPGQKAIFLAGGPGAGKSTASKKYLNFLNETTGKTREDIGVVLDAVLGNYDKALSKIKATKNKGLVPTVGYVYREPADAWFEGVVSRSLGLLEKGEIPRVVPLDVFVDGHVNALQTVQRLLKENLADANYLLIDNTKGPGKAGLLDVDNLNSIMLNRNEIYERLKQETIKRAEQGEIPEDIAKALLGEG